MKTILWLSSSYAMLLRLAVACIILTTSHARSHAANVVLRFDDLPAKTDNNLSDVIREQYSAFGVHFNSDGRHSGIVRAGLANGDPGNWNLNGTNGPNFLGHNSFGLTGTIDFDVPIYGFSVDAARGHSPGLVSFSINAYGPGGFLETQTVSSPASVWKTVALSTLSGITRIEYQALDNFALDNIRFSTVPEPRTVSLCVLVMIGISFGYRRWNSARHVSSRRLSGY
jgi:hypothetical protein